MCPPHVSRGGGTGKIVHQYLMVAISEIFKLELEKSLKKIL